MTVPSIIFGIAIAAFLGGGFHLWRGGSNRRMAIYLVAAQAGFWGGHFAAQALGWTFAAVGPLQVGTGVVGALSLMAVAEVLGRIELPTSEEES